MSEISSEASNKTQSIFWIETDKISPNPLQPRREFDEAKLNDLAESIKQYGILQPLVVVRQERETGAGIAVDYELIAGERRLRAAKIAGLAHVPAMIRSEPADKVKLEIALIENVQREDLNPMERAVAFKQLMDNFNMRQRDVGLKIGKSREFVANTLRMLSLPEYVQKALADGRISEGHARPLMMLSERPEEQEALFNDIYFKRLSVRDAEKASRRIAVERTRKRDDIPDAETRSLEEKLREALGTRVYIERKGIGGKISIEFFSEDELRTLINQVALHRTQEGADYGSVRPEEKLAEKIPLNEPVSGQPFEDESLDSLPSPESEINIMTAQARPEDLKDFTV
ncbi:MAG: ParB/RepB/Spo0J family partition protein [Candidatus Niyogibacteria bacterium]|nr:MAG: ParB/RepB/Spo0J family partition protein [Candidatus Niyogibacteria bacterium]